MEQLLCHLWGDFMFQSTWMATNKYTKWSAAIAHGVFYTFPFLLLTQDWWRLAIICGTHIVIDHYRMAGLWARIVNQKWTEPQPVIIPWVILVIDATSHLTINWLVLNA